MNENLEAHLLGGLGLARGIAEEAKREITLERVEALGLITGLAGLAIAGYEIYRSVTTPEKS